jgi:hypothetical protein
MIVNRPPPSMEDLAKNLAARLAIQEKHGGFETISATHCLCPPCTKLRNRSLKHCHLPSTPKPRHPSPRDSGAYVPEMASLIDNDLNLTDGAKRCARKLAEYIYRKNRSGREAQITVTYLAKALGRCRRSVQRYLRQLEHEGYIEVYVLPSERTRMCFGLLVRLLAPLFPKHRQDKWPEKAMNSGATAKSQIQSHRYNTKPIKRGLWAFFCSEGVWRSYLRTLQPLPPFPLTI